MKRTVSKRAQHLKQRPALSTGPGADYFRSPSAVNFNSAEKGRSWTAEAAARGYGCTDTQVGSLSSIIWLSQSMNATPWELWEVGFSRKVWAWPAVTK